jgi:FAD/FMN-containing dehydrogenase
MSLADNPAFAQFKAVFKGDLVLPTDLEYKASLRRWSVLAERPAGLVAFVKDDHDVAAAVKYAVQQKLEIAVKGKSFSVEICVPMRVLICIGGGHNPSGASSTDGGMVINLSKYCNKVTVDQDARIAHVQGGALWEDVDNATCALGLVTVGGTVSHVSIGTCA